MNEDLLNREQILDKAEKEDVRSNLKQHADKMLRAFEDFNDFSSNRAIWELVQNACDLTKECKVKVDYRNKGLSFSHNGKPFNTKSLISLIKQVSGKYGDSEDIPEVGKYGTGFLTTHSFGRIFYINSILKTELGFFKLENFEIDRSPKDWETLSDNIAAQKQEIFRIIREEKVLTNYDACETIFTYIPKTEQEFKYINNSLCDIDEYAPLVLTINDRLKEFSIIDDLGYKTEYKLISKEFFSNDKNIPLYKTSINKNGNEKIYYSLIDEVDEIEIVLPINKELETFEFGSRIARLFLYYPLIGSEDFGFNFIINCQKFLPTEQRNGVHLSSNKDQVQDQEKENRRIIEKASTLIFTFLKSNVLNVSNLLLFSKINFKLDSNNTYLNDYFGKLQLKWAEELKTLPFVKTKDGLKQVSECLFFHSDLIECDSAFDEIYELASEFYNNIPIKDNILLWSKYTREWNNESIKFFNHEDLVKKISERSLKDFSKTTLINYYQCLIDEDKKNIFSNYAILPNIDGDFQELSHLLAPSNITEKLIEIGEILIDKTIKRFVHPEFNFDFTFEKFNRKHFSSKVNEELDKRNLENSICLPEKFNSKNYLQEFNNSVNLIDHIFYITLISLSKKSSLF